MTTPTSASAAARAALLTAQAGSQATLDALTRDFNGIVAASQANDDEHDPEGATNAFERQHVAALIDRARRELSDIAAALDRLEAGRYGVCTRCGGPVGAARLRARPAAAACIGCASAPR